MNLLWWPTLKNLLLSSATVCIAIYCTNLLGEAETEDGQKATEKNGSNLEQASDADNDPLEPFERVKEEFAKIEKQAREDMKEHLRKELRKNFAKGERALREIYGKDATKDEIIDELIREWEEEYKKRAQIPRDVKLGLAFQCLEELIPELVGISTTWQTTEKTALFLIVTTALAKHYKTPDNKVEKLESLIQRLIKVVPEKNKGLLEVEMIIYAQGIVLDFKRLYDRIEPISLDQMELLRIRDDVRSMNQNAETTEIDKFVTCVDDVRQSVDKAYIKVFSSLTRRLEKTIATVEKARMHSDEAVRFKKIERALGRSLVSLRTNADRVIRALPARNCYFKLDVESLKDDYSLQL